MLYKGHIKVIKAFSEMFDSIGCSGIGRQGLARCIAAFEAGDKRRPSRSTAAQSAKLPILP